MVEGLYYINEAKTRTLASYRAVDLRLCAKNNNNRFSHDVAHSFPADQSVTL